MKKSTIKKTTWKNLPFWLQWGILGGIFGFLLVVIIYIGMSFNYIVITKTLLKQGIISSFLAISAGFLHAALFAMILHKAGIYKTKQIKRRVSINKAELKKESEKLEAGLEATGGVKPTK